MKQFYHCLRTEGHVQHMSPEELVQTITFLAANKKGQEMYSSHSVLWNRNSSLPFNGQYIFQVKVFMKLRSPLKAKLSSYHAKQVNLY